VRSELTKLHLDKKRKTSAIRSREISQLVVFLNSVDKVAEHYGISSRMVQIHMKCNGVRKRYTLLPAEQGESR
jgi:hypothetical protein